MNQDISILFEDLKYVKTSPTMGGCMVLWVGWWMGLSFDILIFDCLPQPVTGLFFQSFLNLRNMWFKSRDYLLETKHLTQKLLFRKCQIITELVAYLYTSNDETACESMEHSFSSLKC